METISIADLKAHLSAELKRVQSGCAIVVLDHKRPVACLSPLPGELEVIKPMKKRYEWRDLSPLMDGDPQPFLNAERGDR